MDGHKWQENKHGPGELQYKAYLTVLLGLFSDLFVDGETMLA